MPMGKYKNFADCQRRAPKKVNNTAAYCGAIKHATEDKPKRKRKKR